MEDGGCEEKRDGADAAVGRGRESGEESQSGEESPLSAARFLLAPRVVASPQVAHDALSVVVATTTYCALSFRENAHQTLRFLSKFTHLRPHVYFCVFHARARAHTRTKGTLSLSLSLFTENSGTRARAL